MKKKLKLSTLALISILMFIIIAVFILLRKTSDEIFSKKTRFNKYKVSESRNHNIKKRKTFSKKPIKKQKPKIVPLSKRNVSIRDSDLFEGDEIHIVNRQRSQIKINLATLYTALVTYKAEYNSFSTDLIVSGYSFPEGGVDHKIPMKFGFISPSTTTNKQLRVNSKRMNTDYHIESDPNYKYDYREDVPNINFKSLKKYCEFGCTATKDAFEAIAIFAYPENKGHEIWTINHKKMIRQVHKEVY